MPDGNSPVTPIARSSSLPMDSEHGVARSATVGRDRKAALFNDHIDEAMKIPDTYERAAVLLIHWEKDLDDIRTEPEVLKLEEVFRDRYKYNTERLKLSNRKNPQQHLNHGIGNFVLENDGEYNLLIIYYAGHGVYDEKNRVLYLDAATTEPTAKVTHRARACWHKAEACSLKEDIQADVLTILDCCFAGDVDRSSGRSDRTYELLAANGPGETTPQPGPHSFTSTLISVLKDIADEGKKISTFDLRAAIAKQRGRRYQPLLLRRVWHGNRGDKHIKLAPLCGSSDDRSQELENRRLPFPVNAQEILIRFTLETQPTDEQIKQLAKEIPLVFKEVGLHLHRARWTSRVFEAAAGVFVDMLNNKRRLSQDNARIEASPQDVVDIQLLAKREAEAALAKKMKEFPRLVPLWFAIGFVLAIVGVKAAVS